MSDRETLEQLLRRRPGLGPKERAAVRRLLEENQEARSHIDAALSLTESLQITHPYIAVRLRHALKGQK